MINITEFLVKKHQINPHNDYVDLGLPSGTFWAKCNLGANKPEEYGLYYQWGSLEGHKSGTFKFNKDDYFKQYDEDYYGLTELREEDDAAYVESDGLARIPTKELLKELLDKCEYEWTKLNGVSGAKFTGPNGNSIFIPDAGYCSYLSVYNVGSSAYILSLTLNSANPKYSYYVKCNSSDAYLNDAVRSAGLSVRAVSKK